MAEVAQFDQITVEQLRAAGGLKWSLHPEAIGAFVAEMDFGTAPVVTDALHAAIDAAQLGYLPAGLSDAMSTATAHWHQQAYGWQLTAEQVHPIADVVAGLEIAIDHYSAPGAPVILPTPAYMPFLLVPGELGRDIIEVPLLNAAEHHALDLEALDRAFRAGGNLLILCNPYNPVGRVFSAAELLAISEVVTRHGGRVFSDEIHAPLVYPGRSHLPYASLTPATAAQSITATSISKAWNVPGLKCAQLIVTNDADADTWQRIGFTAAHGASNLGVLAATTAYTSGGAWLQEVISYLDGSRMLLADLVAEHLPGVGYTPPEGTYIAWLDCRSLHLDGPPAEFFLEHAGVALTDGAACGEAGAGFARLTFATPRPVLEQAVTQMGQALRARHG